MVPLLPVVSIRAQHNQMRLLDWFVHGAALSSVTTAADRKHRMELESHGSSSPYAIGANVGTLRREDPLKEAINILHHIDRRGIPLDTNTCVSLLKACANTSALAEGKQVHAQLIINGMKENAFLGGKLVSLYAGCGDFVDALLVFNKLPKRKIFSWNEMIRGYVMHGHGNDALIFYYQMQAAGIQPDNFTFPFVLKVCASLAAFREGEEIHGFIVKSGYESDVFVGSALVDMYAKCGSTEFARQVFDKMSRRSVVSWNAMVGGYSQKGEMNEALKLFRQMQLEGSKPNSVTIASVLPTCADLAALQQGKEIHDYIVRSGLESDIFVASAAVDMYAKCGRIDFARRVFEKIPQKNVVLWNAMIVGYLQNGYANEALELFYEMQMADMTPTSVTITSVLQACAHLTGLQQGKEIHDYIIKSGIVSDVFVGSSLIGMYAKCGSTDSARQVFDKMSRRNAVSWNAMIACYTQNGDCDAGLKLFCDMRAANIKPDLIAWNAVISGNAQHGHANEALKLFRQMQIEGMNPNLVTITSVLPACSPLAALRQGKEIHDYIIKSAFESDVFVGSALIDMYAKCGNIQIARHVFEKMSKRDVILWNAIIMGYGMHGYGEEAFTLFHQMRCAGMKPDHITFIAILSGCSHAGLVDDAWGYFDSMSRDYCITPNAEHYACMVDLLGRAGHLDDAQNFIKKMPLEPSASILGSLLGACKIHGNIELGEHVAEHLFKLEPENVGYYVLLSNIYAEANRWDDVAKVRTMIKDRGLKKSPGCSWIEVKNKVHTFIVGDTSHPQSEKIYALLDRLSRQMKAVGYVPDARFVQHDMDQQDKNYIL